MWIRFDRMALLTSSKTVLQNCPIKGSIWAKDTFSAWRHPQLNIGQLKTSFCPK